MLTRMWVRKSPGEIHLAEHRARFTPIPALIMACLAASFFCLLDWGGWVDRLGVRHQARPFSEAVSGSVGLALFFFVFLYITQVYFGMRVIPPRRDTFICERCHKVQAFTPSHTCECGGRTEPLRHWRWE